MGWRENAEKLRETFKKNAYEGVAKNFPPELFQLLHNMPEPGPGYMWTVGVSETTGLNDEFVEALRKCSQREMSPLADYLKSEAPLGRRERDRLARFLPKASGKHRRSKQVRAAAELAELFYKELRRMNRLQRIKVHGECGPMKEYVVRATVEDWFAYDGTSDQMSTEERSTFAEQVLALMEKPKSRRAGAEKGIVTFPLFHPKYHQKP